MSHAPTKGEVHLLAYLASLLAVYARRGERASDWGYDFTATPTGAPFSEDLEDELERLISTGAVTVTDMNLRLTHEGNWWQQRLSNLWLAKNRLDYLDSASTTLLVMPVGLVRVAFAQDPDVSTVAKHKRSRALVSNSALARLYDEFNAVADVLDTAHGSLLAASILWLSYLVEQEPATATF